MRPIFLFYLLLLRSGCSFHAPRVASIVGARTKKARSSNTAALQQSQSSSSSSQTPVLLTFAATGITAVTASAKLGLLPGPDGLEYTNDLILRDVGCTVLTAVLASVFVKAMTYASEQGWLEPRDSRKLIHTLSAPLFLLFWPLFTDSGRFYAILVPLLKAIRLYRAGTADAAEASLAAAVSRSGDANEALGGPFIYVCALAAAILFFWRSSAIGIVALCTLAVGDGLADLIGRRYGKGNAWPGLNKSVAGSLAFWVGSTVSSVAFLQWMSYWGCLDLSSYAGIDLWQRVGLITFGSAILELVPIVDDNYSVPLSAALFTLLLLP